MKKNLYSYLKRIIFFFDLKRKESRREKKKTQVRRGGHPYPHYPHYLMDLP
jgi:hypothetical protein